MDDFSSLRSYGTEIDAVIQAALTKELAEIDDPCCDNYRVADASVPSEVEAYEAAAREGCCGFFDGKIEVSGRTFLIGFNYGH